VTLAVQPQGLSAAEKKLIHAVEGRRSDELAALEKVVNTDSGTFNTAGVREVGRYFQQELEALGFQTRRAPMPDAMHRAGHLIAERVTPKAAGKRVLLIGHLDTIFEGQGHRFERAGDTLRCAGVADMAKAVTVKGDLRFLSEGERDQAKARMLEIAAANLPKTTAKLSFDEGPLEADDPATRGFGDFNFIGSLLYGVDGVGVKGEGGSRSR